MLDFVIKGLKNILINAGKKLTTLVNPGKLMRAIGSRLGPAAASFGRRMMNNMKSAKWWSKAARYIRKSGLLSTAGNVGEQLKNSGVNNWVQKGLSAFKYDARSPKQYASDFEYKTKLIESLKLKRDIAIAKSLEVKDELNKSPLDVNQIGDLGEKVNGLSANLNSMRKGVAEIRATTDHTKQTVEGMAKDNAQAYENLGEVILQTSEGQTKLALEGYEDIKNHNMAMHQQSSESIVSDISAHIDAIEAERKEEEEERRKNDWKRKFLENLLLILEWVLDFPGKIKMLLLKVVGLIVLGLTALLAANYTKVAAVFSSGFANFGKWLLMEIRIILEAVLSALLYAVQGLEWLVTKLAPWKTKADVDMVGLKYDNMRNQWDSMMGGNANDVRDAFVSELETQYNEVNAQQSSVMSKVESGTKLIDENKPEKSVTDPTSVRPNMDISGGKSPEVKDSKTKNPITKPRLDNSDGNANPNDAINKSLQFNGKTPNIQWVPGMPATTANVTIDPTKTNTVTAQAPKETGVAMTDVSKVKIESDPNVMSEKDNKNFLNKKFNEVHQNLSAVNMNLADSSNQILQAASQKPAIQNKTTFNFKEASKELTKNSNV